MFSKSLDDVEDEADEASRSIDKVARSVNEATASMSAGVAAATAYQGALESIDDVDLPDMPDGPQSATRASDGLPREGEVDVHADVDNSSFASAHAAVASLPDKHTVEVDSDTDMTGIQSSLSRFADIDIPTSDMDGFGDSADDTDESVRSLRSSLSALPSLLSRLADIDIGEKLLPDRDGRDGSIMPDLPDAEGLEMVDRPPPRLTIPAEIRPSRIDIKDYIPDSIATRVEFDYDRRSLTRLRDRVSESIRVPLQFVRGSTPDAPSFGGGGDDDAFDVHLGSVIPDLPDIGGRGGIGSGITSIGKKATKALSSVVEFAGGLTQLAGISKNVGGLARMAGAIGSIGSASSALAGIGAIAIIGTIVGAIGALVAAIGGLVTAIAGLGAATAGLLGMGLLKRGEQFAATSEDIEGTMEGIQAYLKSWKPAVEKAIEPLRDLPTGDFLEGFIGGGIGALADFSQMTKNLFPDLKGMFDRLGEVWSANQPEFFAELEATIRAFLPMLEGFVSWFLKSAPDALASMRELGVKLLPKIAEMFGSIGSAVGAWIPAGASFLDMAAELVIIFSELFEAAGLLMGPPLVTLFEGLSFVFGLVADALQFVTKYLRKGTSALMDFYKALADAIVNLDFGRFGSIIKNGVLGVMEIITNAFLSGVSGLYSMVLRFIKENVPGAKQAIGIANATSQALGKGKAIPDQIKPGRVNFDPLKDDLNRGQPGKQTAFGQAPGNSPRAPMAPYQKTEVNITNNKDMIGTSESMSQRVEEAMEQTKRYDRRASNPHN